MEEIRDLKQRLQEQRPASWENLPDIPLYMAPVLALMGRQTSHFGDEDALTAAAREWPKAACRRIMTASARS